MTEPAAGQRIDKWLWHARITKSRTLAQTLAKAGHVRINREKNDSASKLLHLGDVLTISLERGILVVKVTGFAERRGPAAIARTLYEEIAVPAPLPRDPLAPFAAAPPKRPDKRNRRLLKEMKLRGA